MGLGVVLVGSALLAPGFLGECRGGEKPKAEARPAVKLVDAIVSRNKAPKIVKWRSKGELQWAALFPKGYDWKEEERVRKAIRRLGEDQTEEVWEELVKRAGDKHYSQTITSGITGDAYVLTVGEMCWRLAYARLVGVYWQHVPSSWSFEGRGHWVRVRIGDVTSWRKKRAKKALYELQIEVCEEAVEIIKALPKEKVKRIPGGERERVLKRIETEIASLKKTKKPLHRKEGPFYFEEWGVYNEEIAAQVREGVRTGKYDPRLIYK
jgi:hypothetical protein